MEDEARKHWIPETSKPTSLAVAPGVVKKLAEQADSIAPPRPPVENNNGSVEGKGKRLLDALVKNYDQQYEEETPEWSPEKKHKEGAQGGSESPDELNREESDTGNANLTDSEEERIGYIVRYASSNKHADVQEEGEGDSEHEQQQCAESGLDEDDDQEVYGEDDILEEGDIHEEDQKHAEIFEGDDDVSEVDDTAEQKDEEDKSSNTDEDAVREMQYDEPEEQDAKTRDTDQIEWAADKQVPTEDDANDGGEWQRVSYEEEDEEEEDEAPVLEDEEELFLQEEQEEFEEEDTEKSYANDEQEEVEGASEEEEESENEEEQVTVEDEAAVRNRARRLELVQSARVKDIVEQNRRMKLSAFAFPASVVNPAGARSRILRTAPPLAGNQLSNRTASIIARMNVARQLSSKSARRIQIMDSLKLADAPLGAIVEVPGKVGALRVGDVIITVQTTRTKTRRDVLRLLALLNSGSRVTLTVLRAGQQRRVSFRWS